MPDSRSQNAWADVFPMPRTTKVLPSVSTENLRYSTMRVITPAGKAKKHSRPRTRSEFYSITRSTVWESGGRIIIHKVCVSVLGQAYEMKAGAVQHVTLLPLIKGPY